MTWLSPDQLRAGASPSAMLRRLLPLGLASAVILSTCAGLGGGLAHLYMEQSARIEAAQISWGRVGWLSAHREEAEGQIAAVQTAMERRALLLSGANEQAQGDALQALLKEKFASTGASVSILQLQPMQHIEGAGEGSTLARIRLHAEISLAPQDIIRLWQAIENSFPRLVVDSFDIDNPGGRTTTASVQSATVSLRLDVHGFALASKEGAKKVP